MSEKKMRKRMSEWTEEQRRAEECEWRRLNTKKERESKFSLIVLVSNSYKLYIGGSGVMF